MIVVNPALTTHTISLVPRTYDFTSIELFIRNESTGVETTVVTNLVRLNRGLKCTFDYTFINGTNYEIKILNRDGDVLYRGKLFATTQNTQEYKQTDGKYYW